VSAKFANRGDRGGNAFGLSDAIWIFGADDDAGMVGHLAV
jgi:hypothetical protein